MNWNDLISLGNFVGGILFGASFVWLFYSLRFRSIEEKFHSIHGQYKGLVVEQQKLQVEMLKTIAKQDQELARYQGGDDE